MISNIHTGNEDEEEEEEEEDDDDDYENESEHLDSYTNETIVVKGVSVTVARPTAAVLVSSKSNKLKNRLKRSHWWEIHLEEAMLKVNPSLAGGIWKSIPWLTENKTFCKFVLLPLLIGHTKGNEVIYPGVGYFKKNESGIREWRPFEPNTWESKIRMLQSFLVKNYDGLFSWRHDVFHDDGSPLVALNSKIKQWRKVKNIINVYFLTFKLCLQSQIYAIYHYGNLPNRSEGLCPDLVRKVKFKNTLTYKM